MQSQAGTVAEYLLELPPERRAVLEAVRAVILENLPEGYEEGMQYGMIGYFVPHRVYPAGYHCDPSQPLPFAGLASQKNHMALYLMCIYGDPAHMAWFQKAWRKTGRKLDMGKSCVRFRKVEDVPLEVIGEAVRRVPVKEFIERYEKIVKPAGRRPVRAGARASGSRKAGPRKAAAGATAGKTAAKTGRRRPGKGDSKPSSKRG